MPEDVEWDFQEVFLKGIDYWEEFFSHFCCTSFSFLEDVIAGAPAAILDHEVASDIFSACVQ